MKLSNLAHVLRAAGLSVVETAGWAYRGYAGQDLQAVAGVVWHHTATNRARFEGADAPTLGMCIDGRPDCAGPLCNIVLGRNGTVYLVAAGVANHAGAGSAYGIPRDLGNHYLIGIEMESSGVAPWDWTADQLRVAPHLGAALERGYLMGLPAEARLQIAHAEYSSEGKIDLAGWPGGMDGLRAGINMVLAGEPLPPVVHAPPVPKPAPVAPAAPAKPTRYEPDLHWEVDPGDTLAGIAAWAGTDVATLAHYNGIKDPNVIRVGEWIWPPVGQGTWTVDPGDTLSKIAGNYRGLSVDRLCYANGINNPDAISVGARLQIPLP